MQTVALGSSGAQVPKIGVGTWPWGRGINGGGMIFGQTLSEEELDALAAAIARAGLSFVDTAAAYGMGSAESAVGRMIASHKRPDWLIATKFTPMPLQSSAKMRKTFNASRKRLGVDKIDLYQLHNPSRFEKWLMVLADLAKEGLCTAIGVSNVNLEQAKKADIYLRTRGLRLHSVQNHFSLAFRAYEKNGLIQWCQDNDVAFLSFMVLEQGLLSGRFASGAPPLKRSRRRSAYGPKIVAQARPLLDALARVAEATQAQAAEVSLAWAIAKGTIPLVGVTKARHVDGIVRAMELDLSPDHIKALEAAADESRLSLPVSWEKP